MLQSPDSVATEGQTDDGPQLDTNEPSLGSGMFDEDTPANDPDEQAEHPDDAATTTEPEGPAPTTTEDPEAKAAGLRLEDYTRKTQEVAEMRRELQQLIADAKERQQAPAATPPTTQEAQAAADEIEDLRQRLNYTTDPEQRAVLQEALNGAEFVERRIANGVEQFKTEIMGQLKPLLDEFPQLKQSLTQLRTVYDGEQTASAQAQIAEAEEVFGAKVAEMPVETRRMARALMMPDEQGAKAINGETGKPYTLVEALAKASGTSAAEAKAAREQHRAGQHRAKAQTGPPSSQSAPPQNGAGGKAALFAEYGKIWG